MRFSEAAGVVRGRADDWFDPVLEQDSPLYIDPYLLFEDADPFWNSARGEVVSFFEVAAELVIASGGSRDTPAWRKALRLLRFPEPHELALGVALGTPRGSGTGEEFAARIADVLALIGRSEVARLASIGGFALFCEGIGVDRISDIVANVIKSKLISYTQEVLARHEVSITPVRVAHASWGSARASWSDAVVKLLPNPSTGGGVLLVPERFLKDIPRLEVGGFWDWASLEATSALRDDLNYDLSESLTKSQKIARARQVARKLPGVAFRFIEREDGNRHRPYDAAGDPRGLIRWYENGLKALALAPATSSTSTSPATESELEAWVIGLAEDFKFVIENTDGWRLLWDDKLVLHRPEKIAQAVAGVMWRSQCKAADVDLSKEANIGRGPVDFKFSQGWTRRALVEVKLVESSHFGAGASKQLPQYLRSEQIAFGVYLVIGFKDSDFDSPRLALVRDTVNALAGHLGSRVRLIIVDARPKVSASKL